MNGDGERASYAGLRRENLITVGGNTILREIQLAHPILIECGIAWDQDQIAGGATLSGIHLAAPVADVDRGWRRLPSARPEFWILNLA